MPKYAVFLDRDGTINEDLGYVSRVEDFKLFPGVMEALKLLTRHDIQIFIITNQAGIARGYYTEEHFYRLNDHMMALFEAQGIRIEKVLFCPHHPEAVLANYRKICSCRKPGTTLFREALSGEKYSLENLAVIGDKNSDIEAGKNLGIRTYLVETGHGNKEKEHTRADFIMPNLPAAVSHLVSDWMTS